MLFLNDKRKPFKRTKTLNPMSDKFNADIELSPQELAKHLKQPDGEIGKQVGELMNKSNKHISLNSYKVLAPKNNDYILEIGMGNGLFVQNLLSMAENIQYTGADISPTMIEEASTINTGFIEMGRASFVESSIEKLPFKDNSFNGIATTNTVYFWPNPEKNPKELHRILKPGGKVVIAYRSKSCMEQLDVAKHGFIHYDSAEIEHLLIRAGFNSVSTQVIEEPEHEFDGTVFQMEGIFTTGIK